MYIIELISKLPIEEKHGVGHVLRKIWKEDDIKSEQMLPKVPDLFVTFGTLGNICSLLICRICLSSTSESVNAKRCIFGLNFVGLMIDRGGTKTILGPARACRKNSEYITATEAILSHVQCGSGQGCG